ncbi:MAG: glycosyltransferase family 39 protein, partial [Solirubrobacterales bacterium]|nr:glycosyltransferase family 39 protein [Solirubrobacterales bacterium]
AFDAVALGAVAALAAILNTWSLDQNGFANTFYSAGVKSMLLSWHNFFYVSADPGGLISMDKPPVGLWLQAASAKVFGFDHLSLLLPEAILGVLTVVVLYLVMVRPFGRFAALTAAVALAVFPSFVAVSRDNNVDTPLIFLMLLACAAVLRAIRTGRLAPLLLCGLLVGLAFNTKTLAAFLVVPGIALAYVVCAPGSWRQRFTKLALAGLLAAVVSVAWLAIVDLTPASQRPYVGSSTDNSEFGLTFAYNGFGRALGQEGGPGRIHERLGAIVPLPPPRHRRRPHPLTRRERELRSPFLPDGRAKYVAAFPGNPSPLRLWGKPLGGQAGWIVPFALFSCLAVALAIWRRRGQGDPSSNGATPPSAGAGGNAAANANERLAALIVLGGWFLVEAAFLSFAKGIVHPYYTSAMAPGAAAMMGAGAGAFVEFGRRREWPVLLAPLAIAATVAAQLVLLAHNHHYLHAWVPVMIAASAVGALALLAARRVALPAVALACGALLIAPGLFAATTWEIANEGTFPAAGPYAAGGTGGYGIGRHSTGVYRTLGEYVEAHPPLGRRFAMLTVSSVTAAPFILMGFHVAALGGYSSNDPALDGPSLARLVARGEARYVLLGGAYASRGGNAATAATLRACRLIPGRVWKGERTNNNSDVLFDCAGRERQLAAQP